MKLMMFLGNDLIEAVPLNLTQISEPGYVGSHKRTLKEKYRDLIQQETSEPDFFVINPTPETGQHRNN
jgi:hypothetical protein